MSNLLNEFDPEMEEWGLYGEATPLGGISAPSMPGVAPTDIWFGDPMEAYMNQGSGFVREVERRYGDFSNPRGGVFDPRGSRAMVPENIADFRSGKNLPFDPYAAVYEYGREASDILTAGEPQPGIATQRSNINYDALTLGNTGLSRQNADMMAEALSMYDPGIVEGLQLPYGLPSTAQYDEIGMLTQDGLVPNTYLDQNFRQNAGPDLGEAAARVRMGLPDTQYVDANGIVDKYPEGTGPYDAPGIGRVGGISGARRGTVVRSKIGYLTSSAGEKMYAGGGIPQQSSGQMATMKSTALLKSGASSFFPATSSAPDPTNYGARSTLPTTSMSSAFGTQTDIATGAGTGTGTTPASGEEDKGLSTGQVAGLAGLGLLAVVGLFMAAAGAKKKA